MIEPNLILRREVPVNHSMHGTLELVRPQEQMKALYPFLRKPETSFIETLEDAMILASTEDGRQMLDGKEKPPYVTLFKAIGETAIPAGVYRVILSHSNRFNRILPEILDVPSFTAIRMHGGNTTANTEGCPLLGLRRHANGISDCPIAVSATIRHISNVLFDGKCYIEVRNP